MKNKVLFIIIILILCLLNHGIAQTVIQGKIINKSNQPISDASVMLMNVADSSVVAYNFSNSKGEYTIYTDQKEKELLLMVYGFNIKPNY
ncbi:MAG: carboxypeptidase-like regulatory domain-containing protein [Cyclobacteriaceae bacterium]